MYARVVRFTDIDIDRVNSTANEIEGGEGPPPGVPAKGIRVMGRTMKKGDEALDAMDPSETPGTRASVDSCEVKASADM